jgi:hypothetical protein
MKTKHLLLILLLPLFASECKKEEPSRPGYQLRQFTMKVNGQTWVPIGNNASTCNAIEIRYRETDPFYPDGFLGLELSKCGAKDSAESPDYFYIRHKNIYTKADFKEENLYFILFNVRHKSWSLGDDYGIYDSLLTYSFTPTTFFPQDYNCSCPPDNWGRIEATFAFDLLNAVGDTLHITDGKMLIDFYNN